MMEQNAEDVMKVYRQIAEEAAAECNEAYKQIVKREQAVSIGSVRVIDFAELLTYANESLGSEKVDQLLKRF